ncbi:hypothetical protein CK203_091090 [Vitis vinifera]|uniref:Uncharacterized protein n=1 Tax=Vitis vinifera TaxID=29760 RepID=A0A438FH86_VITVI|nr:hypothetical protein CK203_091090 [Vitis vinifera]
MENLSLILLLFLGFFALWSSHPTRKIYRKMKGSGWKKHWVLLDFSLFGIRENNAPCYLNFEMVVRLH